MTEGTILLIDADESRRGVLRNALERRGYRIVGEAGSTPEVVGAVANLDAVPSTVMVGATLGRDAASVARLVKRTWPKAQVIEEIRSGEAAPRRPVRLAATGA